jgi:hypothetical protein
LSGEIEVAFFFFVAKSVLSLNKISKTIQPPKLHLFAGLNDICITGVWRMWEYVKQFLLQLFFFFFFLNFDGWFFPNIRKVSEKDGLVPLQQKLFLKFE